jgi:hypothetical protein
MTPFIELVRIDHFPTLDQLTSNAGLTRSEHSSVGINHITAITSWRDRMMRSRLNELVWIIRRELLAVLLAFRKNQHDNVIKLMFVWHKNSSGACISSLEIRSCVTAAKASSPQMQPSMSPREPIMAESSLT